MRITVQFEWTGVKGTTGSMGFGSLSFLFLWQHTTESRWKRMIIVWNHGSNLVKWAKRKLARQNIWQWIGWERCGDRYTSGMFYKTFIKEILYSLLWKTIRLLHSVLYGIFNKLKENRDIDFNNRILSNQLSCYCKTI